MVIDINSGISAEMPKVLHVDDDADFSDIFSITFSQWFEIKSVHSGHEALRILETEHFDAVITDFDMPSVNGFELLKTIKERHPRLPVIFSTGQGNEHVARQAFLLGADDYFTKDFYGLAAREKLANSVKNLVKKRRTEDHLMESQLRCTTLTSSMINAFIYCQIITGDSGNPSDYVFHEVNPAFLQMASLRPEQVIGRRGSDVMPNACGGTFDWLGAYGKVALTGEAVSFEEYCHSLGRWLEVSVCCPKKGFFAAVFSDISHRKGMEEHIKRLNRILKAIRSVGQIINHEKETNSLLRKICTALNQTRGYTQASVILKDDNARFEKSHYTLIQSKPFHEPFHEACRNLLIGVNPPCFEQNTEKGKVSIINSREICRKCPVSRMEESGCRMTAPMVHGGSLLGYISVLIPLKTSVNDEERELFLEMASDVAYALNNIRMEKKKQLIEEELQHEKDRLEAYFNITAVMNVVINADQKIALVNRKACKILGYDEDNLLGENWFDKCIPDETREELREYFNKVVTGMTGRLRYSEYHVVTEQGKKRLIAWHNSFLKNKQGQVAAVVSSGIDITHQRKIESDLRREKGLVTCILETSPSAIFIINSQGRILLANKRAERLLHLCRAESSEVEAFNTPNLLVFDSNESDGKESLIPLDTMARAARPIINGRIMVQQDDGSNDFLKINGFPLFDGNGLVEGMVASVEEQGDHSDDDIPQEQFKDMYLSLMETFGDMVLVDEKGNFPSNQTGCRLLPKIKKRK